MSEEKDLIGEILAKPENYDDVRMMVSEQDFSDGSCREIFKMFEETTNWKVISAKLKGMGNHKAEEVMMDALAVGIGCHAKELANQVKEASRKRKLMGDLESVKELSKSGKSVDEILKFIDEKTLSLYQEDHEGLMVAKKFLINYLETLIRMKDRSSNILGLSTGLKSLDFIINGLIGGELIIIGARPSVGKTSLSTQIAWEVAVVQKKRVFFYSLESIKKTMTDKLISQAGRIPLRRLKNGSINDDENNLAYHYIDQLSQSELYLNDISNINIYKMRGEIKRFIGKGLKPDLIVIDYLQLIETEKSHDSLSSRVGKVSSGLKQIAKELDIPLIALSQLNRDGQEQPTLANLRDSGQIEQDADVVILLHREELYKKDKTPDNMKGKILLDVAKNREGATETLLLNWHGETTKIYE